MMRRLYYLSMLACLALLTFVSGVKAQPGARRGEPNVLSTGYYVVDSDDNAPTPWRPNYFFVDTNYHAFEWRRVISGPRQFSAPGTYFFNPSYGNNFATMDTANEAMAGPFALNMGHSWNYYNSNYDSVYISSNGFIGFGTYAQASAGTPPAYCKGTPVDLLNSASSAPPAIIAALWADLDIRALGDSSRVYYRTATTLDTFMVNYYNFRLRPSSPNISSPASWTSGGGDRIFIKKFQIVLANSDSSIQFNYGPFSGSINNFPPVLAWRVFENSAAIGLVNGNGTQSTSVLYHTGGGVRWDAVNPGCKSCNKDFKQQGQYALKFRRWHNIVRAIKVTSPANNFEICLGSPVTPRATFKNVDSITQTFKVRFTLRNVVTGQTTYGQTVRVLNLLPGASIDTVFPNYNTNPNLLSQLGTFRACAIATSYDTLDQNIGDQWPFDDTVCIRVFGVRRVAQPFQDASNNYSPTSSGDIPDQQKWISLGCQVVEGEDATWDPPPPRDLNGAGYGVDGYHSPVIRLDRTDINGNIYNGAGVGDTLVSFPINLIGQQKAGFTFDYMRSGRQLYPYGYDADAMIGPEHRVIDIYGNTVRYPDSLVIEFKKPTEPGCNPAANGWTQVGVVYGDRDFEFKKFFMTLESRLLGAAPVNYFSADFRFRLRLAAKYDGAAFPPPTDDDDPYFVDNLTVQVPRKPEIEVMWVRCVNPYTKIPASQAVSLPVYVKVANNSANVAVAFPLTVLILDPGGDAKYNQTVTVNSLAGGTDSVVQMPNWNAQDAGSGGGATYVIHAWLNQPGYDTYEDDNGTYTKFTLDVEQQAGLTQEFAYDDGTIAPGSGDGNDVPNFTLITGDGMGFGGHNGSFATKFRLVTKDTIYGARVYFARSNQAHDGIRISLMNGAPGSCTPNDTIAQQGVQATFESTRQGGFFDQFWPYYFPKPIVLPGGADAPGTQGYYWIAVSQLGIDNMMNGGDVSRGGGAIRIYDPNGQTPGIPPVYSSPYGTQYKGEPAGNNGDVSCVWAMEQTAGSGGWSQWTPGSGWWPVETGVITPAASLAVTGHFSPYKNRGGGYTPMIRPLVSRSIMLPVSLVYLNGEARDGSSLLTWATAKESDNVGFYIERKNIDMTDDQFGKIGFVSSTGRNTDQSTGYSYADRNVHPGNYAYRLIQEDANGVQHVSNIVNVSISAPQNFVLEQNFPNPFNPSTVISFTLPASAPTTLVVYNTLGQVVRTLFNAPAEAGSVTVKWDGKDEAGNEVATGTYIYKLTSGQFSATRKMTLSK